MDNTDFKAGDAVVLTDTGDEATIMAIYRDVAWVFIGRDGFETVDIREMKRSDRLCVSA